MVVSCSPTKFPWCSRRTECTRSPRSSPTATSTSATAPTPPTCLLTSTRNKVRPPLGPLCWEGHSAGDCWGWHLPAPKPMRKIRTFGWLSRRRLFLVYWQCFVIWPWAVWYQKRQPCWWSVLSSLYKLSCTLRPHQSLQDNAQESTRKWKVIFPLTHTQTVVRLSFWENKCLKQEIFWLNGIGVW